MRFSLFFVSLIVLPISLFMGLIFQRYYSALINVRLRESHNLVKSYGESIEEEMKTISLKTSALAYNRDFIDLVDSFEQSEDPSEAFNRSKAIESILNIYFDYSDDIITLCLFLKGGESYIYKNPPRDDPDKIRNDEWFDRMKREPGRVLFIDDLTYQRVSGMPYFRYGAYICPESGDRSTLEGILVLYQSQTLNSIFRNDRNSSRYILKAGSGEELFSAGAAHSEGQHIVRKYQIGSTSWNLENDMNLSEIRRPVLESFIIFLGFMLLITVMVILFVMSQFRMIIDPVNRSIDRMAMVEKGDFSVRLEGSPIPELNRMAESFNSMVWEIEKLTGEIREKEKEKRKVEIRALQYQINPHFLSNTLNSIKIMARMIQADSIKDTTTSLMRILSDTFRNPGSLNKLDHEMDILKDYIQIMKVRFGDSFSVRFRLDCRTESLRIMKLLIQPIVENAVVHGLREKTEGGKLMIGSSVRNGNLVISVIDNGEGMEKIPDSAGNDKSHKGMYNIGLQNVIERIRLNYGKPYGLAVNGVKGCYTRVDLILPAIGEEHD
jgi:sensor histidine kinase YesM